MNVPTQPAPPRVANPHPDQINATLRMAEELHPDLAAATLTEMHQVVSYVRFIVSILSFAAEVTLVSSIVILFLFWWYVPESAMIICLHTKATGCFSKVALKYFPSWARTLWIYWASIVVSSSSWKVHPVWLY